MRRFLFILPFLFIGLTGLAQQAEIAGQQAFNKLGSQLSFIQNKGQLLNSEGGAADEIDYYFHAPGMSVYFTPDKVIMVQAERELKEKADDAKTQHHPTTFLPEDNRLLTEKLYKVEMEFVGANQQPKIFPAKKKSHHSNFYNPVVPDGALQVHYYEEITYRNIYPGIDLKYYFKENALKYDFIVHPGANPKNIKVKYHGAKNLLKRGERLMIGTSLGYIEEEAPYTFLKENNQTIASQFVIDEKEQTLSFQTGNYDKHKTLIIDPQLEWSTYIGDDNISVMGQLFESIQIDDAGNIFVVGSYRGLSFPVLDPGFPAYFDGTRSGFADLILVKFDAAYNLQWATFYGGSEHEYGYDIRHAPDGKIFVSGKTSSFDFPLQDLGGTAFFQPANATTSTSNSIHDALLLRFNANGAREWATYFGGDQHDELKNIVFAPNGNMFVIGGTNSKTVASFPYKTKAGAHNQTFNTTGGHGVIAEFDPVTCEQLWTTIYAGLTINKRDGFSGLDIDKFGNVYVCGSTNDPAWPAVDKPGAKDYFFNTLYGEVMTVAKFDPAGQPIWGTFLTGTSGNYIDRAQGLTVQEDGNLFVIGNVYSPDMPIKDPGTCAYMDASYDGFSDSYIVNFSPFLNMKWATYYGGSDQEAFEEIISNENSVYVYLQTKTTNLSTQDIGNGAYYQSTLAGGAGYDIFLSRFTDYGKREWATYFGGSMSERGSNTACIKTNDNDDLFMCGSVQASPDYPLKDAGGYYDDVNDKADATVSIFRKVEANNRAMSVDKNTICNNTCVDFQFTGTATGLTFEWTFEGATPGTSTDVNPTNICYNPNVTDTFDVMLVVYDGCEYDTLLSEDYMIINAPSVKTKPNSITMCSGETETLGLFSSTLPGYSWSPATSLSDPNIAEPDASPTVTTTYTVTGTDAAGCTSIDSVVVNIDAAGDPTITSTNTYCENDAAFNLSAVDAGGTWSGTGITNASNGTFDPGTAGPGTFDIVYAIAGSCPVDDTIQITVTANSDPQITPAGPYCANGNTTSLSVSVTGGVWSGTGITDTATGTFDPATAGVGTHEIIYTYVGSCGAADTIDITVDPGADANIASTPSIHCVLDDTVKLFATNAGGYWQGTGITDTALGVFDPAAAGAGVFSIFHKIDGACPDADTLTITVSDTQDPQITPAGPYCTGDADENLIVSVPGGTWQGIGISHPTNGTFSPSAAGTGTHEIIYTYTGTCNEADTINIIVSNALDATIAAVGTFCSNDDSITLYSADPGGVWTGTGIINASAGTFDPATAGAGTHSIIYTLSGSCGDSDTLDITVNAGLSASIDSSGPYCISDPSVNLTAANAGGIWSGTGITASINGTFDPATAGAGTHPIAYTISGNCPDTDTVLIVVSSGFDASINVPTTTTYCANESDFDLTAVDLGGVWSGTGITDYVSGTFDPATADTGTHQIIYTISGSCGDADTINLQVIAAGDASITPAGPFCTSDAATNLTAATSGGTWLGSGITDMNQGTFDPGAVGVGIYAVVYTISGACPDDDTTFIQVRDAADATISTAGPYCEDDPMETLSAAESGGTWTGTGITDGSLGSFDPATAGAGTHAIVYTISGSCGDADSINVIVNPAAVANAGSDETILINNSTTLNATTGDNYFWTPSATLSCDDCQSPEATPTVTTTYVLTVTTDQGCKDVDSVTITIDDMCGNIFVPTAFSPNNDEMNDELFVRGNCIISLNFTVYDRWGTEVFHSDNMSKGWNGYYQGQIANTGQYIYYIFATLDNGEEVSHQGVTTLIR